MLELVVGGLSPLFWLSTVVGYVVDVAVGGLSMIPWKRAVSQTVQAVL